MSLYITPRTVQIARKSLKAKDYRSARKVVKAASWEDDAVRELIEELELDPESININSGEGGSIRVDGDGANNGESEWMIFQDYSDAEQHAVEYVQEMLEEDPESFNESFLHHYLMVRPLDRRLIAQDQVDARMEDMDTEDYLQETGMVDTWEELKEDLESTQDTLHEQEQSGGFADSGLERQIVGLERQIEDLVLRAEAEWYDEQVAEIVKQLEQDPIGYFEDMGTDVKQALSEGLLILDYEAAAQAAVRDDGVDHFLDTYDGYAVELPGGYMAYGTN